MRTTFLVFFLLLPLFIFGQNNNFTLGHKSYGIIFGNSKMSNGLRLNVWDDSVKIVNGVSITVKSSAKKTNGIDLALLFNDDSISNGFQFATTYNYGHRINGFSIGGMGVGANVINGIALGGIAVGADDSKINGIAVSGLGAVGTELNGVFIGLLGANNWREPANTVNGAALGFVWGVRAIKFNGLALGISNTADTTFGILIGLAENYSNSINGLQLSAYNKTSRLNGLQIGIVNNAKNGIGFQIGILNRIEDKRRLKTLPFINFYFRRKASS